MKEKSQKFILWLDDVSLNDIILVGGKNASVGEMRRVFSKKNINIPNGFCLTAKAYRYFLESNNLKEKIKDLLSNLDSKNLKQLKIVGEKIRKLILSSKIPEDLEKEILENYEKLSQYYKEKNVNVAIRSSGTVEDVPTMSFAGQFETYLNVSGKKDLIFGILKCYASAFGDRVIAYREEKKVDHLNFALSVGIIKMVRSDLGSSGIIFTLDTESGFRGVVLINSIFGVGEMIVKGKITPDEFYVFKETLKEGYKAIIRKELGKKTRKYIFNKKEGLKEVKVSQKDQLKFSLTDEDILTLAKWAIEIENHYKNPQDIEWAKDGKTGELFILQSRPETVHSIKKEPVHIEYIAKTNKKPILKGIAIGNKIGQGKAHIIENVSKIGEFKKGEILVTKMTDPDWVPAMRIASAIITEEGSKTCHAAIVSRELGVPAVVAAQKATKILKNNQEITVDCSRGFEGLIFDGKILFDIKEYRIPENIKLPTKIMVNIGSPDIAFSLSYLPVQGVGLARVEFILAEKIRIHPLALLNFEKLKKSKDKKIKKILREIEILTIGYKLKKEYFINKLAEGISQIACAFWPKPVIVRFSDLKSNEYRALRGGELFEPKEENPMLGWRGASRYYDKNYQDAFKMECEAVKISREKFGLKNIWIMIPFCRTPEEGKRVLNILDEVGLKEAENFKRIVMCEIPSNVILIDQFLDLFDGMSIGSNDLTQLIFGIDRDSGILSYIADERNEAVKEMIKIVIKKCKEKNKYCGICGEAPSTFLDFADFLIKEGIESISLNPNNVIKTILDLNKIRN